MKWYGIDEDIYNALVDLISEAHDAATHQGDEQSETYYAYLLGELEECKIIAKSKKMNTEEDQKMLKLQRYLRMLHEGLKDKKDTNKNKRRKIARDAIEPASKKKYVPTHMSLKDIEKYLKDDPELSDHERFELYCDERDRLKAEDEARNAQSMDEMLNDLGIQPHKPNKK